MLVSGFIKTKGNRYLYLSDNMYITYSDYISMHCDLVIFNKIIDDKVVDKVAKVVDKVVEKVVDNTVDNVGTNFVVKYELKPIKDIIKKDDPTGYYEMVSSASKPTFFNHDEIHVLMDEYLREISFTYIKKPYIKNKIIINRLVCKFKKNTYEITSSESTSTELINVFPLSHYLRMSNETCI
jgi:hypothetical protein